MFLCEHDTGHCLLQSPHASTQGSQITPDAAGGLSTPQGMPNFGQQLAVHSAQPQLQSPRIQGTMPDWATQPQPRCMPGQPQATQQLAQPSSCQGVQPPLGHQTVQVPHGKSVPQPQLSTPHSLDSPYQPPSLMPSNQLATIADNNSDTNQSSGDEACFEAFLARFLEPENSMSSIGDTQAQFTDQARALSPTQLDMDQRMWAGKVQALQHGCDYKTKHTYTLPSSMSQSPSLTAFIQITECLPCLSCGLDSRQPKLYPKHSG